MEMEGEKELFEDNSSSASECGENSSMVAVEEELEAYGALAEFTIGKLLEHKKRVNEVKHDLLLRIERMEKRQHELAGEFMMCKREMREMRETRETMETMETRCSTPMVKSAKRTSSFGSTAVASGSTTPARPIVIGGLEEEEEECSSSSRRKRVKLGYTPPSDMDELDVEWREKLEDIGRDLVLSKADKLTLPQAAFFIHWTGKRKHLSCKYFSLFYRVYFTF